MVELCFVAYGESRAHDGSSRIRTSAIRSHARRAAHRHARHERVSEYQLQSRTPRHAHQQEKGAIVAMGSPSSCLDSSRGDPFQSLALPVNEVEQMLIDYCKLRIDLSLRMLC